MILAKIKEIKDICMPRLKINCNRALALPTTLVDVPGRIVEDAEHGHDAVGDPIGPLDLRAIRADVRAVDADTPGPLGDLGALLERVIDALDAVILHGHQEAAGHLRAWAAAIKKRRSCVGEILLGHQVVGRLDALLVRPMDADGHTHDVQRFPIRRLSDKSVIMGQSLGCTCDLNPPWMKGRPQNWSHAFGLVYFYPDGNFQLNVVDIFKYRFVAPGTGVPSRSHW